MFLSRLADRKIVPAAVAAAAEFYVDGDDDDGIVTDNITTTYDYDYDDYACRQVTLKRILCCHFRFS